MSKESAAGINILVQQVAVLGKGAILLTGPSSCGKGEVASSLCRFLSLPSAHHVSMGEVLRQTIKAAQADSSAREMLRDHCGVSDEISVLDPAHNASDLIHKVERYQQSSSSGPAMSQLEWLNHCVHTGLLVPDDWAERIIEARLRQSADLHTSIFILDGYPRTVKAAESLLELFSELQIKVLRVVHLSITKSEMKSRALARGRSDDTNDVLDRRYDFYVEHVQPCIDYLKTRLGTKTTTLIDAHQPVILPTGELDLEESIRAVTVSVLEALGLPRFLLDLESNRDGE